MAKKKKAGSHKSVAQSAFVMEEQSMESATSFLITAQRPKVSPYTNSPVALRIGPGSALYYIPKSLLKFPKWIQTLSWTHEVILSDVDEDTGHVLVHYLYTGAYQTLNNVDTSRVSTVITEFKRAVLVYTAAKTYDLPGLQQLAMGKIEEYGTEMDILHIVKAIKDSSMYSHGHTSWFQDYLRTKARAAFEEYHTIFIRNDLFGRINDVAVDSVLTKCMMELYNEKVLHLLDITKELTEITSGRNVTTPQDAVIEEAVRQEAVPEEAVSEEAVHIGDVSTAISIEGLPSTEIPEASVEILEFPSEEMLDIPSAESPTEEIPIEDIPTPTYTCVSIPFPDPPIEETFPHCTNIEEPIATKPNTKRGFNFNFSSWSTVQDIQEGTIIEARAPTPPIPESSPVSEALPEEPHVDSVAPKSSTKKKKMTKKEMARARRQAAEDATAALENNVVLINIPQIETPDVLMHASTEREEVKEPYLSPPTPESEFVLDPLLEEPHIDSIAPSSPIKKKKISKKEIARARKRAAEEVILTQDVPEAPPPDLSTNNNHKTPSPEPDQPTKIEPPCPLRAKHLLEGETWKECHQCRALLRQVTVQLARSHSADDHESEYEMVDRVLVG